MRKILLTFIILNISFLSFAQYKFSGKITDKENNPLPGVSLMMIRSHTSILTDSTGYFSFEDSLKEAAIMVSYVGFTGTKINLKESVPVTVSLDRNKDLLPETIVNAFERNSSTLNVAASVSVLSKAALTRYNDQSFVQAVNTVPGVKMDERSPGSYRLSIRGNLLRSTFGVRNVKIYWNGIPFTDADGNSYFNQLSPGIIDRIEIIKGPAGSMYGAGTGGVVLLNSGAATAPGKLINFETTAGSYGQFSANASYVQSGQNSNTISYSHQQADGYRAQAGLRRDVGNYTGSYLLSAKDRLSANVLYSDLYYQTPGGLTLAEMKVDPSRARPAAGAFPGAETQNAAIYVKTIYAGIENEYRFNTNLVNSTSVYGSYTDFKNPAIRNYEHKYQHGIGARDVLQYQRKNTGITFGGEYQYGFTNTSTFGNRLGVQDTLQYNDKIKSVQYNVFLQADLRVSGHLSFSGGLSYNNFRIGYTRVNSNPLLSDRDDFPAQLAPRISALYKLKQLSLYAVVSKGYSPPSIDEVHATDGNFNKTLKAETGWNYEAGVKGDIIKSKLWMDASYYIFGLQNTIVSRRDSSGADYYVNAGRTDQRGTEIGLTYLALNNNIHFVRLVKVWTNYTNIHARFKHYQQETAKYDGNKLTGTPPNVVAAGLDVNTSAGVYLNITYSYTDRIPLNDANTFFGTSYNLLFSKAGYRLKIGKSVSTDVYIAYEKSFNNPYSLGNDLNAAGNRFYNPSAPHNFTVGAKFGFDVK